MVAERRRFRVAAYTRSGEHPAVRRVRGVELHEVAPPEAGVERTLEDLRSLIRTLEPDALMPLDDASVLLSGALEGVTDRRPDREANRVRPRQGAPGRGRARGRPARPADGDREVGRGARGARVPGFVKPARALYEVNDRLTRPTGSVVADEEELERAAAEEWHPPLLVQPLLEGVGEGVFGLVTKDGVTALSAHRRVRMLNPQGSASSACESIAVDEELVAPIERFLTSIGWSGLFMVELLRDTEGRAWFMELNGRAWGSMALARRRGFEYPAWTVQAALDPDFVPVVPTDPPEILARHLGMELAHLAFVVRGPQSKALGSWPKLWPTIRAMTRTSRRNRLYNWRRSEPDVLAADTWGFIRFFTRRMLRSGR